MIVVCYYLYDYIFTELTMELFICFGLLIRLFLIGLRNKMTKRWLLEASFAKIFRFLSNLSSAFSYSLLTFCAILNKIVSHMHISIDFGEKICLFYQKFELLLKSKTLQLAASSRNIFDVLCLYIERILQILIRSIIIHKILPNWSDIFL